MSKYDKIVDELHYNIKKHKHVFIRVPKTGSQSINISLKERWNHYSAFFCKNELGDEKWNSLYSFAFVRNPWGRLRSWFSYHYDKHSMYKKYGMNGLNNWIKDGCPHHYNQQHQKFLFPENPMVQKNWLCDENGEIIVKFVGKLESIEGDYQKLRNKLKSGDKKLSHNNKTDKKKFNLKYTEETIKIVNELFTDDIEFFNYKKRP